MPLYCTCGAEPPSDARFCHKCGRPLYDEPTVVEEQIPPPLPVAASPAHPPEIGFHNGLAVRIGFATALLVMFVTLIPLPLLMPRLLIGFFGAGFIAVYLYEKRTGQRMNLIGGARMGWITGIFLFLLWMVQAAATVLLAPAQEGFGAQIAKIRSQLPAGDPNTQEFIKLMDQPAGPAILALILIVFLFTLITMLPTAGGIVGAKILEKHDVRS